jgi:hypothetical protein
VPLGHQAAIGQFQTRQPLGSGFRRIAGGINLMESALPTSFPIWIHPFSQAKGLSFRPIPKSANGRKFTKLSSLTSTPENPAVGG